MEKMARLGFPIETFGNDQGEKNVGTVTKKKSPLQYMRGGGLNQTDKTIFYKTTGTDSMILNAPNVPLKNRRAGLI